MTLPTDIDMPNIHAENGKNGPCFFSLANLIGAVNIYQQKKETKKS